MHDDILKPQRATNEARARLTDADMALAAAAPELLAALRALLNGPIRHEVRDGYENHYPEIAAARAAIAKATEGKR